MTELLERKEYLVGLTIFEARGIQGLDAGGSSDPFLKVKCADQVQQSSKKFEVNSAIWAQCLTFAGIKMNQYELETFEINIELYDHNALFINELIGQYSIGLSTLYRNTNHEFYKTWVSLFRKDNPNKCQAYLLISAYIVGPNEKPPVHSPDDGYDPDGQAEDSDEDEDAIARKIESIKRAQGVTPVAYPDLIVKNYQLSITLVKAEGLPACDGDKVRPFVSARVFGVVQTTSVRLNSNPNFLAKLQYPIFYPILNDKITMRIWHKNAGLAANVFIASIPEHPSASDPYNLSQLFIMDGRMKPRWINLYGTPPQERSSKTKSKKEGSQWLGRILIALNMVANEKPQIASQQSNPVKEPAVETYQLWLDVYQLLNCELIAEGNPVWIIATVGKYKTEKIHLKYKEKLRSYRYSKIQVPALIDIQYPADPTQIPDIFINVYTDETFSSNVRVAYLRIQVKDCLSIKPKPNWFRLSSPFNNTAGASCGLLLTNIQFLRYDANKVYNPERITKNKAGNQQYQFYAQIYQGFELASMIPEDKLTTRVDISLGKMMQEPEDENSRKFKKMQKIKNKLCLIKKYKANKRSTDSKPGRYPVWDHFFTDIIDLDKELTFESDMRVTLQNKKSKLFGGFSNQIIGEFAVPLNSITNRCDKPQFFNILNEEGQFMGQILANFYLRKYVRDPKTKRDKNYKDKEDVKIQAEFEMTTQHMFTVDIKLGIFAIRNLIKKAKQPKVYARLTHDPAKYEEVVLIDKEFAEKISETHNPNFGVSFQFSGVELAAEPLFWPFIEIKVEDQAREDALIAFSGCEPCFTTISLVDFAERDILPEADFHYAQQQLRRNQDRLQIIQKQIDPGAFLRRQGFSEDIINFNALKQNNGGLDNAMPAGEPGEGNMMRQSVMPNGQVMNQVINDPQQDAARQQGTINYQPDLFAAWKDSMKGDFLDISQLMVNDQQQADGGDLQFDLGAEKASDDEDAGGGGNTKKGGKADYVEIGIIIGLDSIQDLVVTKQLKERENKERDEKVNACKAHIKKLQRKFAEQLPDDQLNKDKIRIKMMEVTDQMDGYVDEVMTEEKFWGALALDDDVVAFDYGRDFLKEGIYENVLKLPYQQIPLFTQSDWFKGEQLPIVQVAGILRSGNISGATLKMQIQMSTADGSDDEDEDDPEEAQLQNNANNQNNDKKEKKKEKDGESKNLAEEITQFCAQLSEEHPYDILKAEYMRQITQDRQQYKVRVYIISAQNLTATGQNIDFKSRLAGMMALSSANPYPIVRIGDGSSSDKRFIKEINERDSYMENELNPRFLRTYELDAFFPEDWKLTVAVWDKGLVEFADKLIGQTVIDLENRLFSNQLNMGKAAVAFELEEAKKKYSAYKPNKKNKKEVAKQKRLKEKKDQLAFLLNKKLKSIQQFLVPVEYRELLHPSKSQAQGIVEMWVEVINNEEGPKIPIQRMQIIKKELFEIRFIVWETRGVPLVDGDKVDIWVKVIFDPTGWPEDAVEKRTDVHMGSKNGWGSFNWRMKFLLEVPCDYPRLKISINDAGVLSDEAIGESCLNLKRSVSKLLKEGRIEVPKTNITFRHPNKGDEDRGVLMFSMTILAKEDADAEPVGESWDEPNENPFLQKPTAGRGLGDMLSGFGFDLDLSWNPFGKYIKFVLALLALIIIMYIGFIAKM